MIFRFLNKGIEDRSPTALGFMADTINYVVTFPFATIEELLDPDGEENVDSAVKEYAENLRQVAKFIANKKPQSKD